MASSLPLKLTPRVNDIGISILHDPEDAIADIVFVHGLQGHPRKTWTCESDTSHPARGSAEPIERGMKKLFSRRHKTDRRHAESQEPAEVFWPLDLLPLDCRNSRILTWGYDSKVSHFFGGASNQSNVTAHAQNLLAGLKRSRLDCHGRSIIFVAHSLGGIIVKDVIRRAAGSTDPILLDIYSSTAAILFLGTPHRGSNKAGIAEIARRIASVSGFDTTDKNIRALQVDSTELELIHELFIQLYERKDRPFKVVTFQEAKGIAGTSYLKLNEKVVEPFSSRIGSEPIQTINANHMAMCRFSSRDDEGYKQVVGELTFQLSEIQKGRGQHVVEGGKEMPHVYSGFPSPSTTSTVHSLNDAERKCVAVLTQNLSSAADYKSSLPDRVEGTCQWILSNYKYLDWNLQDRTCLLWIIGYPGSGKTILSAYLLERLGSGDHSPSSGSTAVCYFFCDEKIDTQRDGRAIIRSLIHQLLIRRRSLIKYVKTAYDVAGPQFDQSFHGLWKIFIAMASDKRVGPLNVLIDAIDECEQVTREQFLRDVLNLMNNSKPGSARTASIKFLVTSRPLLGRQYATDLLEIDLSEDDIQQDLQLFIQTKVAGIAQRTRCKPEVRAYLENALYLKADRTFLWVTLVLHLLEKSFLASQKDFKRIIDTLPQTLTDTYERFLHAISIEYQPLASKLLHFLVGSLRPLTLGEMRTLVAMQDQHTLTVLEEDVQPNIQETIEGVLGPLVRIWDSRIYLVHQSLKEFLQTLATQPGNSLSALYGVSLPEAHCLIAEACVSYLLLDEFRQDLFSHGQKNPEVEQSPTSPITKSEEGGVGGAFWDTIDFGEDVLFQDASVTEAEACAFIETQNSFYDYSARHWAQHFLSAGIQSPPKVRDAVMKLSEVTSFQGLNWFRYYWSHAETELSCPRDFVPLVTTSYFGHLTSIDSLLSENSHIDSLVGGRAVYWAARMGHQDVVDKLLGAHASPDISIVHSQTALVAAVQFNRLDVVKSLLKDEGQLSEPSKYRVNHASMQGRTPLSIAAGNGLAEIARELLNHSRIQPDIADFDQWTPLFWSTSGNHLDVLQLLITDGRLSINHVDRTGRNVLSWAAAAGELELVRYLLSVSSLRADEPDHNGRTALSFAAGNGHLETTVVIRRSQRIHPSIKDNDGRNALSWACGGGHHQVVEYLIKHDPKGIDEEDMDGWTPLAWALFSQAPQTVQLLLDSGLVDVNKRDNNGRSALSFAAGYGYLRVVQILLKVRGIEIDSGDNDGRTPISHAARHDDIVKILQEARE